MPDFEVRQSSDRKTWNLTGLASRTGIAYEVADQRGRYTETVNEGAFRSTLARGADVVLAVEHGPPLIARTPKTLALAEDADGLRINATLDAADPDVQATVSKIQRGILPEMSFSFRVPASGDRWSHDGTQRSINTLELDGGDVSIVRSGANGATEVSVRGSAAGAFEVRSSGIVAVRQALTGGDENGDLETCPQCGGTGQVNGVNCPLCNGTGEVNPDDWGEDERSAKYSAEELHHMMRLGQALPNAHGDPSYPIGDREDIRRAVRAVGRGSRSPERIRMHVIKNAKRLGAMDLIPDTWNTDGSLNRSRSSPTVADLKLRAAFARSDALELEFRQHCRRAGFNTRRDRSEALWRYNAIARDARLRGGMTTARAFDAAFETEFWAEVSGL